MTGSPFNDPEGRWRVGGGINVPLTVSVETEKPKAEDLIRVIRSRGISCELIRPPLSATDATQE